MLQTKNVRYSYNSQVQLRFPDINCAQGSQWLLLGQSGSGKTTLLHLLGGLLTPQEGKVIVGTTDLSQLSGSQLDQFRGKNIGIIFQRPHFVKALRVQDNLALARSLAGLPKDTARIHSLLDRLNIKHKLHAAPTDLSQGEQQRVAIARALVNEPTIILADEPTSALDDKNAFQVADLLAEQAATANATLLIVTHDGRLKERFEQQIILQDQQQMVQLNK